MQEDIAPELGFTCSSAGPEVTILATTTIESKVRAIDPPEMPILFSSLPMLTVGNLYSDGLLLYLFGGLLNLIIS